jgi:hypothetical protein
MMIHKNTLSLNRKHLRSALISSIIFSILVVGFILVSPRALQAQIPESVASCIPDRIRKPVARVDNLSNYAFESATYYLFGLLEEGQPANAPPVLLVIKTTGQDCHELFFNPAGEPVQLAQFMPQTVARRLTLGLYEHQIDKIGIDKFKADIAKVTASRASITWFDEEVWALRQLGIPIPANVQIAPLPSKSKSQNL